MISKDRRWHEAEDIINTEGWKILEEESENEIREMLKELRTKLDARLAGKIDGIEWVFTNLCSRVNSLAKQEEEEAQNEA